MAVVAGTTSRADVRGSNQHPMRGNIGKETLGTIFVLFGLRTRTGGLGSGDWALDQYWGYELGTRIGGLGLGLSSRRESEDRARFGLGSGLELGDWARIRNWGTGLGTRVGD